MLLRMNALTMKRYLLSIRDVNGSDTAPCALSDLVQPTPSMVTLAGCFLKPSVL